MSNFLLFKNYAIRNAYIAPTVVEIKSVIKKLCLLNDFSCITLISMCYVLSHGTLTRLRPPNFTQTYKYQYII